MDSQQWSGIGAAVAVAAAPLMTREAFASAIGLPVGVLIAQAERGYWPQITVGKRVFINVEAVRLKAAERAQEFVL
jgi:hypothetical protein